MAKIERKNLKIFAENAASTDIGQFGSALAGKKLETGDVEQIQALDAWRDGWQAAAISNNRYPALQERNGVDKVFSYFLSYLLQAGIPEYDNGTTYYIGSFARQPNTANIYISLTDDNLGNLLTSVENWKLLTIVDVDLSNVTTGGIERAVGWGIPDYSAGVSLTTGTFTALNDGCIIATMSSLNNKYKIQLTDSEGEVLIAGKTVGVYADDNSGTLLVKKGQTYYVTNTGAKITYYPMLGEE